MPLSDPLAKQPNEVFGKQHLVRAIRDKINKLKGLIARTEPTAKDFTVLGDHITFASIGISDEIYRETVWVRLKYIDGIASGKVGFLTGGLFPPCPLRSSAENHPYDESLIPVAAG